jgi:Tfp pilus assembly protein PilF
LVREGLDKSADRTTNSAISELKLSMRDITEEESLLRRFIAADPANVEAHRNLGTLLAKQGDPAAALESFRAALALDPNHVPTLSNFGAIYLRAGELHKAEVVFRQAVALDPGNLSAHCSLANALAKQGNFVGAIEASRQALTIDPTHAPALCDFGTLLDLLGDGEGAMQCFQLALASRPNFTLAKFNLGLQHLAFGNFAEGWPGLEARWETPEFCAITKRPALGQPQWRGEDIRGSSILLYSEQGLGDTLQFVRYAPMVAELGATVVLRVQPPLVRLLRTLDPRITVASVESNEGAGCKWQSSLMSLPFAFRTDLTTIPAEIPYLRADPAEAEAWARRLPERGLRVGLVWAGSPTHIRDRQRSLAFKEFVGLTQLPGITFYSLQKGPAAKELASTPDGAHIVDLSEHLDDFTDTAAIIANLDLVLSADTSVAHLAGAMGKPVWVLLPRVSEWRWLKDRADTPWYPTMRLFRQTVAGRWDDVMEQAREELKAMS